MPRRVDPEASGAEGTCAPGKPELSAEGELLGFSSFSSSRTHPLAGAQGAVLPQRTN